MAEIDSLYRSSIIFNQSVPTTNTLGSSFNYSTAENLYGSNVLLYTGLIPTNNPLSGSGDGTKYAVDGIDIIEKVDKQEMEQVEDSFFAFSHSRLTYVIPSGSQYSLVVWAKDSLGEYTIQVPTTFYDVFYYEQESRYVVYFKEKYEPIYGNGTLNNPLYSPAITCYRYCGPKGIENIPGGGGGGSQGPQGQSGFQGTQGSQGQSGFQGTQGSQGLQGQRGLQGIQGLQGQRGLQGIQGLQGQRGLQGIQGFQGTGIQGPQGASGGGGGGGLAGTRYIYVTANGTDTQNATELQTAYNTAKTMSPSASSRFTIVAGPGYYNFTTNFIMDTDYIDLVSLDGNRSIVFNGTGTIEITALAFTDVFVKGVDVSPGDKPFILFTNLNLLRVENCKGGSNSFSGQSGSITVSGTFIDCDGGIASFSGLATGTFINCVGGNQSFGTDSATGTFIDCTSGDYSFASNSGISTASGSFTNCTSGNYSFGVYASGIFNSCTAGYSSFGLESATGTFNDCTAEHYSFSAAGTASGTFDHCVAGFSSFGSNTIEPFVGSITGKLYYCRLTSGSGAFGTPTAGGKIVLCIDGSDNIINSTP